MLRRTLKMLSSSQAAIRRKAVGKFGAPPAVSSVLDEGLEIGDAAAVIRPVGCTRRVLLLEPYLTAEEIEGLAYRIRTLSKNEGINSVLIATDDNDDSQTNALPSTIMDRDDPYIHDESVDPGFPPAPGHTWHVAGGYDPLELYKSGRYRDSPWLDSMLSSLGQLALATRGDAEDTKVPIIMIPHGAVHDGGFALCMATYVMATRLSTFRVTHPSKGLSLDPIGLSYTLPRLGQEFRQPAADYIGCGMILGLMGYEADASDMVETGLATHYMETPHGLGLFEQALAEIPPWNQQGLVKKPVTYMGDMPTKQDRNAAFRNVAVADAVHCFSCFHATGDLMWTNDEEDTWIGEDPSLVTDPVPWHAYRTSDLVNYAATFDDIFTSEETVQGILERFREIAARRTDDPEEQEGIDVAADFVRRLELQSPLAVRATYELLLRGAEKAETLSSCMEREKKVLMKLFGKEDFSRWAEHAKRQNQEPLRDWKHRSIADVSSDEVAELFEEM